MAILEAVFSGQPTDQLEGLVQPYTLRCLRRMNRMLRFEALKAYLRVTPFRVTIVSAYPDFDWYHRSINYGQPAPAGAPAPVYTHTLAAFRQMVRRAQILVPSRRSVSWGAQGRIRMSVHSRVSHFTSSEFNSGLDIAARVKVALFADHWEQLTERAPPASSLGPRVPNGYRTPARGSETYSSR